MKYRCVEENCGWMFEVFLKMQSHCATKHGSKLRRARDEHRFILPESERQSTGGNGSTVLDGSLSESEVEIIQDDTNVRTTPANTVLPKTCKTCNRNFNTTQNLEKHVQRHANMKYRCVEENCGWMFDTFPGVQAHCFSKHGCKLRKEKDEQRFRTSIVSVETNVTDEESAKYVCSKCSREFNSSVYERHIKIHDRLKYKCLEPGCGWMYAQFGGLVGHYNMKHGLKVPAERRLDYLVEEWKKKVKPEIKCLICGRAFCKTSVRDLHMQRHDKLRYRCEQAGCGQMYEMPSGLKDHQKRAHKMNMKHEANKVRPEKCPICTRKLQRQMYDYHVRCHHKMKYGCLEEDCGWMFESFGALQSHYTKMHHKHTMWNRDYVVSSRKKRPLCPPTLNSSKCKKQERIHDKLKYKCLSKDCGWIYETFKHLQNHSSTKHQIYNNKKDERNYIVGQCDTETEYSKCHICSRELRKMQCKRHIARHNKMKYQCPVVKCGWMFEFQFSLRAHVSQVHGKRLSCFTEEMRKEKNAKNSNRNISVSCDTRKRPERRRHTGLSMDSAKAQEMTSTEQSVVKDCFKCSVCARQFGNEDEHKKHVQRHTLMRFKCLHNSCGWMFETYYMLKWHYSMHHASGFSTGKSLHRTERNMAEVELSYPEAQQHAILAANSDSRSNISDIERLGSDSSESKQTTSNIENSKQKVTEGGHRMNRDEILSGEAERSSRDIIVFA